MKFVTFVHETRQRPGVLLDRESVLDIEAAADIAGETIAATSVLDIIRGGRDALAAVHRSITCGKSLAAATYPLARLTLLAPIPVPTRNVFCVGRNYVDHVAEGARALGTGGDLPAVPQFFTKATHAVIGPDADVRFNPRVSSKMDYEVELGLVIGRRGRDIPPDAAFEHIFGYTIVNDVSARDLQRTHGQWFKGKSLDTTCPIGPCIVERGDISDPGALELSLTLNGERRQHAFVRQMIFDIPRIVAELSAGLTLEPGDIIATGTPSGVGFAMEPPQYMKDGDVMVCGIGGIGELKNRLVEVGN